MEDYNFNENAITMPDLLKIEDDTDDLVVAFIDKSTWMMEEQYFN